MSATQHEINIFGTCHTIITPEVALEREVQGDLFLQDIGQGFGFRPGSFDGAIRCVFKINQCVFLLNMRYIQCSISVLQWLLNAETSHPTSSPPHRLTRFFTTLHSALRNPSRAVFQFYPSSDDQIQLITSSAQKAGFGGGLVVDYPNSKKAKKIFLCLFVGGGGGQQQVPKGLEGEEGEEDTAKFERRRDRERGKEKSGKRKNVKDKDWILKKKEVCSFQLLQYYQFGVITDLSASCTENAGKKAYLGIPNSQVASEDRYSELFTRVFMFSVSRTVRCIFIMSYEGVRFSVKRL